MGHGAYSAQTYASTAGVRNATGTSFTYTSRMKNLPRSKRTVHDDLDPQHVNGNGPFAGKITRECADTTEHPTTVPIVVLMDVTGSMRRVPREMQAELPNLLGLIQQNGYVEHPSILFGAIGDAYSDRAPLQVSQFEADNTMDDQIEKIYLEGNGGSQNHESYELALYFMARHTHLDAFTNRGRKGYLFIVGDELAYDQVDPENVQDVIDDGFQGPLSFEDVLAEVQEKYEVFFIIPGDTHGGDDPEISEFWTKHLGDNVLTIEKTTELCETIGLTVATREAIAHPLI